MGEFLGRNELVEKLYEVLKKAKRKLFIVSPYLSLSDNLKLHLEKLMNKPNIKVRVLFGKNENDKSKSLTKDDFDFLCKFNNIEIKYNKNLHAKYFANERIGIVTSLNFHEYSLQNNVEVGTAYRYSIFGDVLDKIFGDSILSYDAHGNNLSKNYFNNEFNFSEPVINKMNGNIIYDNSNKYFDSNIKKLEYYSETLSSNNDNKNEVNSQKTKAQKKHISAYNPWSSELDIELENLYCENKTIQELMSHFGRSKRAIELRIEKLELEKKYPKNN